ncbi:MAG: acyl-CoA dehydrogenase family protein [Pseudomonadales bacterium]|nr:acyl-CoA dehydrogenase family protein [Halioglobus sp.]MCP5194727.1 acyl-CoA dehydrogenase family protein [Pseudomonadales bacterium]
MTMVLNEEQRLLKMTVTELLQKHAPVASLRALRDANDELGYSAEFWQQLVDMGIPSIVMPACYGGLGFGFAGLGAVMEEMGRTLAASPLFATVVLGASALELAGASHQQDLLPDIIAGKLTLALAVDENHHHNPLATAVTLTVASNELLLDGTKVFVLDGHSADKLLVVARSMGNPGEEHGLSLVLLPRETPGVDVQRTILMDGRNAAKIQFNKVKLDSSALVGSLNEGWPILQQVLDRGAICIAAEMLGGALEVFRLTMDYIKEREQFGVRIGSFQALQHRSAQMYCQLEQCRTVILKALSTLDEDSTDTPQLASMSKAMANQCYAHISNEAVQMHGGMGITDDLDIGLYLKRARVSMQILGDTSYHQDRYARLMGY